MKIKKRFSYIFGLTAVFPLLILLVEIGGNFRLKIFKIPNGFPVVIITLIFILIILVVSVTSTVSKVFRLNRTRLLDITLASFVIFDIVSYSILFSIFPTPTFCRTVTRVSPLYVFSYTPYGGGGTGGLSTPVRKEYKECGLSVFVLKNWQGHKVYDTKNIGDYHFENDNHIEWDRIQYWYKGTHLIELYR
jgi:hypothetical protein